MELEGRWAYRAKAGAAVDEVEVLAIGEKRPPKVKVRFVAEEAEGREEWVPRGRLLVLWSGVDGWLHRERQWKALTSDAPYDEDPEFVAAELVFETCPLEGLATMAWSGRQRGVLQIDDLAGLTAVLHMDTAVVTADPRSFTTDDGVLHVPWPTTRVCAHQAAQVFAERVLDEVNRREHDARREAIAGRYYASSRGEGHYSTPEICAEVDKKYEPGRALVRQWCGAEALANFAELQALRDEVVRIGRLMEHAIDLLRRSGHQAAAADLEQQLGIPIEELRRIPSRDD